MSCYDKDWLEQAILHVLNEKDSNGRFKQFGVDNIYPVVHSIAWKHFSERVSLSEIVAILTVFTKTGVTLHHKDGLECWWELSTSGFKLLRK